MNRIMNILQRSYRPLLGGLLLLLTMLALASCNKKKDTFPLVSNGMFQRVDFQLPKDQEYKIKVNGILKGTTSCYVDINSPINIEVFAGSEMVFEKKEVVVPENLIIPFFEVVGHGLQILPEEQQHPLSVTVAKPNEGVEIFVKGLEGYSNGIAINNGEAYMLSQEDINKGGISIEVIAADNKVIWDSKNIKSGAESSQFVLFWGADQKLVMVNPPTNEQREKLDKKYDTWVSFMYSSKHYSNKSLVLEVAPARYLTLERRRPTGLKEGFSPFIYILKPDVPTPFQFIEDHEDNLAGYLFILNLYDPDNQDEPLLTIDMAGSVYQYGHRYTNQGEDNYKFRCYQFIPKGADGFPLSYRRGEHFPMFQPAFSFE